jgi:hypothetical protein
MSNDWLPARRDDQIGMAKDWLTVLRAKAAEWFVPDTEIRLLEALTANADAILIKAKSSERTMVITAQCKEAFSALTEKMLLIKNRCFLCPPLTEADLISLQLTPKDLAYTPPTVPTEQVEGDILRPGVHLLEIILRIITRTENHYGQFGFRIYWGIFPNRDAMVEETPSLKREPPQIPGSVDALPFSKYTKRKRERFNFDPADSGKLVFFCVRLENTEGDAGPWGPLLSAVIP